MTMTRNDDNNSGRRMSSSKSKIVWAPWAKAYGYPTFLRARRPNRRASKNRLMALVITIKGATAASSSARSSSIHASWSSGRSSGYSIKKDPVTTRRRRTVRQEGSVVEVTTMSTASGRMARRRGR